MTDISLEFIWFSLPAPLNAEQVAEAAQERENLIVAHGNMFEVWGDEKSAPFNREIRVCYAWEDEHKLTSGIVSSTAFTRLPHLLTLDVIGKVGKGYRVHVE